jgi:hypothetical protein
MKVSVQELESIVRNRICGVCTDRNAEGNCGLENPGDCALFRLFPQVALAIQSTTSDNIEDYIRSIRENVCSICQHQDAEGNCETRRLVACALDAYLLLIVEAIEEATGKTFDRTGLAAKGAGSTSALGG